MFTQDHGRRHETAPGMVTRGVPALDPQDSSQQSIPNPTSWPTLLPAGARPARGSGSSAVQIPSHLSGAFAGPLLLIPARFHASFPPSPIPLSPLLLLLFT